MGAQQVLLRQSHVLHACSPGSPLPASGVSELGEARGTLSVLTWQVQKQGWSWSWVPLLGRGLAGNTWLDWRVYPTQERVVGAPFTEGWTRGGAKEGGR